jgi:hypothetical protein
MEHRSIGVDGLDPIYYAVILIVTIFILQALIKFLLADRKRREVVDLFPGEFKFIQHYQNSLIETDDVKGVEPVGRPLYTNGMFGAIRIHKNGIMARYTTIERIKLTRPSTGFQTRLVVDYDKAFYTWERIAAIYPIRIRMIRKEADQGIDTTHHSLTINDALAWSDDFNEEGPYGPKSEPPDWVTAIQVETIDYRTSLLCPGVPGVDCRTREVVEAMGVALGHRAKQVVRMDQWLTGAYFIFEEPRQHDVNQDTTHRGDRNRVLLGDLHKHYVIRSQEGYGQRRKATNRILKMENIRMLDEYLGTDAL